MSTATRLRRIITATPRPIAICSPKNGEKLRNTPNANAAAVRSGESESAGKAPEPSGDAGPRVG